MVTSDSGVAQACAGLVIIPVVLIKFPAGASSPTDFAGRLDLDLRDKGQLGSNTRVKNAVYLPPGLVIYTTADYGICLQYFYCATHSLYCSNKTVNRGIQPWGWESIFRVPSFE